MPTLQDEIQIVEHFRNTRQQEEAGSGFSGRGAFGQFQEGQQRIQRDIADAMAAMKEAQKPNKLKMLLDFITETAYAIDANTGNSGKRRGASEKLDRHRKEILASRGAKRDRALKDFQTTVASLDTQSEFNVREFNAMIGQLDREQKAEDSELNRRMKEKEFGLDEEELIQKTFYEAEIIRVREDKNASDKERQARIDKLTAEHNKVIRDIAIKKSEREEVTDDDRANANAQYSAEQRKIAMELAIKQLGDFPKFQTTGIITTKEGDPSPLEQYSNALQALSDMYLRGMPQIKDLDTTGADAVNTIQGGLEKIQSGFSPQGGQSIEELMGVSGRYNRGLIPEGDLIKDRDLQEIIRSNQGFSLPQPTASTRVR